MNAGARSNVVPLLDSVGRKRRIFLFRTKHKLPAHGRVGDSILEPFSLPHDAVSASRAPRRVALLPRVIPSSPMASIF